METLVCGRYVISRKSLLPRILSINKPGYFMHIKDMNYLKFVGVVIGLVELTWLFWQK